MKKYNVATIFFFGGMLMLFQVGFLSAAAAGASKKNMQLVKALQWQNYERAQELIEAKIGLDECDSVKGCGMTPLILTIFSSRIEMLKALIENKVRLDVQDRDDGMTALMHAARWRKPLMARELIAAGANIYLGDYHCQRTALVHAIFNGDLETVKMLIDAADDRQKLLNVKCGECRDTPLMHACKMQKPEMVRLLLDAGAGVSIRNNTWSYHPTIKESNLTALEITQRLKADIFRRHPPAPLDEIIAMLREAEAAATAPVPMDDDVAITE